jgi:hypothetical protein
MARVNTVHSNSTWIISHYCWNASSARLPNNQINALNWGSPIGEDWNVSSVNNIQVLERKKKRIGMCWCSMLKNFKGWLKINGRPGLLGPLYMYLWIACCPVINGWKE